MSGFSFFHCVSDVDSDLPADRVRTGGGRWCQETETGLQAGTGGRLHEPGELRTTFPRAHWDRCQKTRGKKNRAVPEHLYIFCFLANFLVNQATMNLHHIKALLPRWLQTGQGAGDCCITYPWCNREGGRVGCLDVLPAKPSLLPLEKCLEKKKKGYIYIAFKNIAVKQSVSHPQHWCSHFID